MNTVSAPITVCIIDDDKIYQFAVKRILELINPLQRVLTFFNGREAIEFFSQCADRDQLPDVIFLDINMPEMDGWEFLEKYKSVGASLPKNICIYMISSSIDENDVIRSRSYDIVKDFITKPVDKKIMAGLLEFCEKGGI